MFFGTQDHPDAKPFVDSSRFHFLDRLHLWFTPDHAEAPGTEDGSGNSIVLSEAFYDEINQHRIPVERHAVATFAHSPGVLDFYIWLVWKCWTVRHHGAHVPLFSEWGLANQLGTREYSSDRFFRRKINFWLRQVKALWPDCPAHISDDGRCLLLAPSRGASRVKPLHWSQSSATGGPPPWLSPRVRFAFDLLDITKPRTLCVSYYEL
ncbi:MAG: hypothetical protein LAO04_00415 [Acidobacteriia bacterium]|nr:hypothetical protein [Terriglobia bacterium]